MSNVQKQLKDKSKNDVFPYKIYSEPETQVGIWKNGKPLYRRIIDCTMPKYNPVPAYGGVVMYNLGNDIDEVVFQYSKIRGKPNTNGDFNEVSPPYTSGGKMIVQTNTIQNVNTNSCYIALFNRDETGNMEGCTGYIIVEYTKITD